jgi:glycosyltransferase involved in cell wall biosynthesis
LLCTGRVEDRKGVHVAVEALAHLPEATLDVVGPEDTRYVDHLRRLASRLGVDDRVHFVGAVERRELPDKYRSSDVFVFPVLWEEPFGLVPLEAMACGTPVIATGTGGSAEFLADGRNCLIVPKGDAAALADAVRRLAADPMLRASLVERGHQTVAQLGIDRLADVLERWHRAAAERYGTGIPADRPPVSVGAAPSASELDRDA